MGVNDKPSPAQQERVCGRCGDSFIQKNGKKNRRTWYCGYCYAVQFGEQDARWIPHLGHGEKLPPGFQEEQ
jgi:ribosomal protein S27AE